MMGWQSQQLDHMQITCTSLRTDNHASTSPLSFYRLDALPAAQPTALKAQLMLVNDAEISRLSVDELMVCVLLSVRLAD